MECHDSARGDRGMLCANTVTLFLVWVMWETWREKLVQKW